MLSLILALALCQDQIDKLIDDLDSDKVEVRMSAEAALKDLDGTMYERIAAIKSNSVEAQSRLKVIVSVLEHKSKLLAVTKSYPTITASYNQTPIKEVFDDLSKKASISFATFDDDLKDVKISASFNNAPLAQVFDHISAVSRIQWSWSGEKVVWQNNPLFIGGPAVYVPGYRIRLQRVETTLRSNFSSKSQVTSVWVDMINDPWVQYVSPTIKVSKASDENGHSFEGSGDQYTVRSSGLTQATSFIFGKGERFTKLSLKGQLKVHYQLKGEKVSIKKDEIVKVGDFELSTSASESHHLIVKSYSNELFQMERHVGLDSIIVVDSQGTEWSTQIHSVHYNEGAHIYFGSQTYDVASIKFNFYKEVLEHVIPFEFKDIELP